jgi:TRAP-type transport system small permease protein
MDFLKKIAKSYEIFCRILFLLMTTLVITFVFLRYFFGVTFVWAEEMITMLFISTTYFGAVLGMQNKEHINIGFFSDLFPKKAQFYVEILNHLIILGLQIAVAVISMKWIDKVGNVLTNGMRLPIKLFYSMMPISAVLIGGYCVIHIVIHIMNKNNGSLPVTVKQD